MAALLLVASVACSGETRDDAQTADEPATSTSASPTSRPIDTAPSTTTVVDQAPTTSATSTITTDAPRGSATGVVISPNGVVLPVLEVQPEGHLVRTPCDDEVVISGGTFIEHADVVVDPGHGGRAPGAVGPGGLVEADANLEVSRLVVERLEAEGFTSLLTRTADYEMSLGSRAQTARSAGAAVFLSLHFNSDPDGPTSGPGSEAYFQHRSPESRRLAGLLYEEIHTTLSGVDATWVGDTDAGTKYRLNDDGDDYYGILRHSAGVPAALIESAFISNPAEEALIGDPTFQAALAGAIARAVVRYHGTSDPGSGFVEPYPRDTDVGGDGTIGPNCVEAPL